jgi:uncharacterized protein YjbJ (UPF0337 family)
MGLPNDDEVKGKWDQAAGAIKDKVGEAAGDRDLEERGEAQRAGGNLQEGFGTARRKVGDAIKDVADDIAH